MAGAQRFEHFEILTDAQGSPVRLGPGGMGTTYRAYDLHLRRLVALKIINDAILADPTARRRFFNEARAAALVDHPNVARVLYLCPETAPECFFAMELVEGESLAQRVSRLGPMPAPEALQLLRPIADALVTLEEHGLVHRDIKPENIMIANSGAAAGRVKLIDFGLAKSTKEGSKVFESVHTGERFIGSIYYASPEQIQPRGKIDGRSDFYSLGATLWYVVTGAPPFTGTVFDVQLGHVEKEPDWQKLGAGAGLSQLLKSLLAKLPENRPDSAAALIVAWDAAIAASSPAGAGASAPVRLEAKTTELDLGATRKHSDDEMRATDAAVLPEGCARPPAPAELRPGRAPGLFRAVRRIPKGLPDEYREALARAARLASQNEVSGILTVRGWSDNEIESDWRAGVSMAQILRDRPQGLPFAVLLRWLKPLADAFDSARLTALIYTGLQSESVIVELAGQPAAAAQHFKTLPPEEWGQCGFWLDPLAGFSPMLVAVETGAAVRRAPTCTAARDFIAGLARLVLQMLGSPADLTNFAGLPGGARKQLLADALEFRNTPASVAEWARAFVEDRAPVVTRTPSSASSEGGSASKSDPGGGVVAPPKNIRIPEILGDPKRRAPAPPLMTAPPRGAAKPAPAPPPPAPPPTPKQNPAPGIMQKPATSETTPLPQAPPRSSRPRRRGLRVALTTVAIVSAIGAVALMLTPGEPEEFRALTSEAETAIQKPDRERAEKAVYAAERIVPNSPKLTDLKRRIAAMAAPPAPSTTTSTPTPAPVTATKNPLTASKAAPYVNVLGMKFVPVSLPNHKTPLLVSVYETRVADIKAWAKTRYTADPYQDPNHPAVRMLPIDADAFCVWLTKQDAPQLPKGWSYRIPTVTEWLTANSSSASASPGQVNGYSRQQASVGSYPWGGVWPPPGGAGNFADRSLAAIGDNRATIPDYDDGFARTAPVGKFGANANGLFDMAGNVAEICIDAQSGERLLMGGSWADGTKDAFMLTIRKNAPEQRGESVQTAGFRVVLADFTPNVFSRISRVQVGVPANIPPGAQQNFYGIRPQ